MISHKMMRVAIALFAGLMFAGSRDAGAQNLVVNGDFSDGNTGFLHGNKYVEPVADALIPASVFTVARNTHRPFLLNSAGAKMFDYFDHTTGDDKGAFLLVNGAGEPGQIVWGQRIAVKAYTNYYFSTWVSTWTPDEVSPAELQFRINGKLIGPVFTASETAGLWGVFEAVWNSGNNTVADIYVINQNTQGYGNDFALDDIMFQRTPLSILGGRRLRSTFYPAKPKVPIKP
ncbi:MAG: hypothetical protein H7Y38_17210 [Armatimonadetes bacterium]|nr:hypothetical protein [Armatimonadota bacterium]